MSLPEASPTTAVIETFVSVLVRRTEAPQRGEASPAVAFQRRVLTPTMRSVSLRAQESAFVFARKRTTHVLYVLQAEISPEFSYQSAVELWTTSQTSSAPSVEVEFPAATDRKSVV